MIDLDYKIIRIRAAELKQRTTILLAEASPRQDVLQMIGNSLPNNEVPSDTPVVLLWIGKELFTYDNIIAERVTKEEFNFIIDVAITKQDEPIHANVVTVPVVQVLLGQLASGSYQIIVTEKEVNKKHSSPVSTAVYKFSFLVK